MTEQASLATTTKTTQVMKNFRNRSKVDTKQFLDELAEHLNRVQETVEGSQKIFFMIESDLLRKTVTITLSSTLAVNELPEEVHAQFVESERALRKAEDGDGKGEITVTYEGKIDTAKPTKTLEQRIQQMSDERPEVKEVKKGSL